MYSYAPFQNRKLKLLMTETICFNISYTLLNDKKWNLQFVFWSRYQWKKSAVNIFINALPLKLNKGLHNVDIFCENLKGRQQLYINRYWKDVYQRTCVPKIFNINNLLSGKIEFEVGWFICQNIIGKCTLHTCIHLLSLAINRLIDGLLISYCSLT